MVCEWGMSDLGPLKFGEKEEEVFLGREVTRHNNISEETAVKVDREVDRIVKEAYKRAHDILTRERTLLDALAEALLEYEILDGPEIEWIVQGKDIRELKVTEPNGKPTAPADAGA
jgi:cell division protease FtsH